MVTEHLEVSSDKETLEIQPVKVASGDDFLKEYCRFEAIESGVNPQKIAAVLTRFTA